MQLTGKQKTKIMKKTKSIIPILDERTSRRQALKTMGLGTLGIASLAAVAQSVTNAVTGTNTISAPVAGTGTVRLPLGFADVNTLNFALNLEYLEAEFYTYATTGLGIEAQGIGVGGQGTAGNVAIKANPQVNFTTSALQQYALEIAADEREHVAYLRQVLGNRAIARPTIDLNTSFNQIAQAAGLVPAGGTFDPFADEISFLLGAFLFEDVGVTAYRGATARLINRTAISAAAGILGTEAYHASIARTKLFEAGPDAQAAAQAISDLRDTLDGAADDDQGVTSANNQGLITGGTANIVPTNANGLVFSRTPRQVLNIVYFAVNANQGGFFPNGVNSFAIRTNTGNNGGTNGNNGNNGGTNGNNGGNNGNTNSNTTTNNTLLNPGSQVTTNGFLDNNLRDISSNGTIGAVRFPGTP
jgi:hypothetical protein